MLQTVTVAKLKNLTVTKQKKSIVKKNQIMKKFKNLHCVLTDKQKL